MIGTRNGATSERRHLRLFVALLGFGAFAALLATGSTHSAVPGANGLIATPGSLGSLGIQLVNPNGTGKRAAAAGRGKRVAFAIWSPDGTRLAYLEGSGGIVENGYTLHIGDAFAGGDRAIAARVGYGKPSWSPDGRWIAVTRAVDQRAHVVVIDVETGAVRDLGGGQDPAWSPDGSRIAAGGSGTWVWVKRPEGGEAEPILVGERRFLGIVEGPAWSPDGTRIAFAFVREAVGEADLYVVGADGSGKRKLAAGSNRWPEWSPDGRQIAFQSRIGLRIMPAGGGASRPLGVPGAPSWQRCGPAARCALPPLCPVPRAARNVVFASELAAYRAGRYGGIELWVATGTAFADLICGSRRNDSLTGRGGSDAIVGGGGNDTVKGGPGNDYIDVRGGGIDTVYGGPGRDTGCFDRYDARVSVEVRAC